MARFFIALALVLAMGLSLAGCKDQGPTPPVGQPDDPNKTVEEAEKMKQDALQRLQDEDKGPKSPADIAK